MKHIDWYFAVWLNDCSNTTSTHLGSLSTCLCACANWRVAFCSRSKTISFRIIKIFWFWYLLFSWRKKTFCPVSPWSDVHKLLAFKCFSSRQSITYCCVIQCCVQTLPAWQYDLVTDGIKPTISSINRCHMATCGDTAAAKNQIQKFSSEIFTNLLENSWHRHRRVLRKYKLTRSV